MNPSDTSQTPLERRLSWGIVFVVFLLGGSLTLSSAVRARSWDVPYPWEHWIGFTIWLIGGLVFYRAYTAFFASRDPLLWFSAWLLTGWGLMTIWRLSTYYGWRQSLWLAGGFVLMYWLIKVPSLLESLQRYKYIWLVSGLFLTALTLVFGSNPSGEGLPRLWLGCCGVYLQPSEPLKLLLLVYLSAYLAGSRKVAGGEIGTVRFASLLAPTALMGAAAIGLLIVQRDLGTASLFFFLYATQVYLATEKRRVALFGALAICLGLGLGYSLFDVVRLRVDAWINPWLDPSGRSYQIVQSLIAIANGGILGRGLGMGSPSLVPVSHSDFIFSAVVEENGLMGALGLFALIAVVVARTIRAALSATDEFQRFLAAGFAAYLGGQSLLIIGGNIRLLPLTGVTLPFVSYGGSSLLVSLIVLVLILRIGSQPNLQAGILPNPEPYLNLGRLLLGGIALAALASGWFGLYRAEALNSRTDNPRRSIADRFTLRGTLYDRSGKPLALTVGRPGEYQRIYLYPPLSVLIGYTSQSYGQAGLERTLDDWLRGTRGHSTLSQSWQHLLYGMPPFGLDLRLTIDLAIQRKADELLAGKRGAIVVVDAKEGDILALASQPGFDSNNLDENWETLMSDTNSPLLNRAIQGQYKLYETNAGLLAGVPELFQLNSTQLPILSENGLGESNFDFVRPIQLVYAAAALSQAGVRPPVTIVSAVKLPESGWTPFGLNEPPARILNSVQVENILNKISEKNETGWQLFWTVRSGSAVNHSWFLAGSLPAWAGTPYAVVVVLEKGGIEDVRQVGEGLVNSLQLP